MIAALSRYVLAIVIVAGIASPSYAELLIDQGRQVEGLWVFPMQDDPTRFKYLPQRAALSTNLSGEPQFSLTFFVDEESSDVSDEAAIHSIGTATGGAILHVLLEYGTDPAVIEAAGTELRRATDIDDVQIVGPVVFDSGTFSVISSVLTGEGARAATLIAQRPAPVLEGQSVALSFELEPRLANILLATMRTDTPDFSVAFDLIFHGLSDTYDAEMVIDWSKTKNSMQAAGGVNIYVVSLEAEAAIEKAFQDGAIELVVNGDDAAMENIVQLAYSKALEIMYAPIELDAVPEDERGGMADALGMMLDGIAGSAASSALGIGVSASYRMKDLKSEGVSRMSFRKAATVRQSSMLTLNLGDFYARYGNDERFIRVESTGDCDFAQRRVFVLVDGALRPEIGRFVNHVGVTLKKEHSSGESTLRQLIVNPSNLDAGNTLGPLTYNSNGDDCDDEWLTYDFQTDWSFVGGGSYSSSWAKTNSASIGLSTPFHRQEVMIEGDMPVLIDHNVRAVVVEVASQFFGQRKTERRHVRPSDVNTAIEPISIVQPLGHYDFDYKITWILDGGQQLRRQGQDDLSFLFIDELPTDQ